MSSNGNFQFDPSRLTKAAAAEFSSSASEDEDDYRIPGVAADDDEFGDFNPRKKRRLGKNNKEKAALGIFGSDSEDDGPGSRWKRKSLRNKGMTFVSTNSKANKSEDEMESEDNKPVLGSWNNDEDDDGQDDDEEDDDDNTTSGIGLGFGRGLGSTFQRATEDEEDETIKASPPKVKSRFQGGGVLGRGFVPSSANEPVLKETVANKEPPQNKPQHSTFTSKGKINAKGFGARMMAKMGYVQGTGLGKEGQGRNLIIEANLRPQGAGLGAVKEKSEHERREEKRQAELRGEKVIDSDEEEKKRKRAKKKALGGAAGSGASTPRRQKTKYLTAEELKASAPGLNIPEAFTPILDMTGPGSKMLTSTSGIMTPTSGVPESTELIEARKLVKRAQADLQAFSEEWRSLEERKTWVNAELEEREREMEDLRSDFERLQAFSSMIAEQLTVDSDWDLVINCLQKAAELGTANADTADIAVAAVHPFFRDTEWDPLAEPSKFTPELKRLAPLLMKSQNEGRSVDKWHSNSLQQEGIYRRHQKATTPYESMMYKNWLPRVVTAIREWDPLTPSPMLDVVESWNDLLPPFIRAQVMDHVARKLETAVSDWNPKKKRQSHHLPHTWLFPWLQHLPPYHLDPKGTGLVADVKRKFRQLIDVWEFERGTVPGLKQWEDVLGSQWRPLIMSHVLPSMGRYLRMNFRVDPADQEPYLPVLTGVMTWNRMLGDTIIAEVLVQDVFPMWYDKLREWLALGEADLEEVAEWYSWWRGVLLKDMAHVKGVRNELDKGLQIMNIV
ncbi:G-patch domain-containing protein [Pochonia chlamydosporia 170]|uniref:G-patch domain-containing protein n=1 Tax=Pochonia chlamydosporia 170 TaxID=1380566 RepID=A0A179G0T9_METCM|nr:G-patch domain-containing protein [Pochonia chlamydosporia 170]OAQ70849.1 G-patch domain-containing protein [Pochonia chlamydosporia 170]